MKFNMIDSNNGNGLRVESVRIEWKYDDTSDVSYLEQDYSDCEPEDAAKYRAQDAERLKAFNAGEWCMMGCVVVAVVSRDIGGGSRRLQEFSSGGLWNIESDCGNEYRKEVEGEQFADLREHLEAFGVVVTVEQLQALAGVREGAAS